MSDKTGKKNYHADQSCTASYKDERSGTTNAAGGPPRRKQAGASKLARGNREERNERFGAEGN